MSILVVGLKIYWIASRNKNGLNFFFVTEEKFMRWKDVKGQSIEAVVNEKKSMDEEDVSSITKSEERKRWNNILEKENMPACTGPRWPHSKEPLLILEWFKVREREWGKRSERESDWKGVKEKECKSDKKSLRMKEFVKDRESKSVKMRVKERKEVFHLDITKHSIFPPFERNPTFLSKQFIDQKNSLAR